MITAFLVVNVHIEQWYLVWLAPTVVIVPVIVYWNSRLLDKPGADRLRHEAPVQQ